MGPINLAHMKSVGVWRFGWVAAGNKGKGGKAMKQKSLAELSLLLAAL